MKPYKPTTKKTSPDNWVNGSVAGDYILQDQKTPAETIFQSFLGHGPGLPAMPSKTRQRKLRCCPRKTLLTCPPEARQVPFSLKGPPLIQNRTPTQISGTLSFGAQKGLFNFLPTFFKVGYPHSTDSELCGHTRHVNQFHHVISQLRPKIGPLIS